MPRFSRTMPAMERRSVSARLSHIGRKGELRMVDVSAKEVTTREAEASALVTLRADVLDALLGRGMAKGDALAAARVAGVMAAKRTSEWIPLCHPLPLDWVRIEFDRPSRTRLRIICATKTSARTGVEMEALVGVSAAALTIYDMAKAGDRSIILGPIRLERKSGGRSGVFTRSPRRLRKSPSP